MKKIMIYIGTISFVLLLAMLSSVSAVQYKTVKTSIQEKIAELGIENIWLKILLYTIFTGLMIFFALTFGKAFGNGT